jgi:hypothetical protein
VATLALIAVVVLAVLVFLLFGALLELYQDVRQLRDVAGILDRPLHVELSAVAGTAPSRHGLPQCLDTAAAALVLFLSEKCATCRSLAASLGRSLPSGLWIVLEAGSTHSAAAFLDSYGFAPMTSGGRVSVDVGGNIAARIGLNTTPVGFRIENGVLISATTVPSTRYLTSILPKPIHLRPDLTRWENGEDHNGAPKD